MRSRGQRYVLDLLGGRTRARTWDPLIKSQLLYQLSYAPGTSPETATARGRRLAKRPRDVQQTCGLFESPRRERKPRKRRLIPACPGGVGRTGDGVEGAETSGDTKKAAGTSDGFS